MDALDVHSLVDVGSVVIAVLGGYFTAMRSINKRLSALEIQVAVIIDRDRRKRITDYEDQGIIDRQSD